MGKKSRWFGVRMIRELRVPRETVKRRTYEDRTVVVRAVSEQRAREKAEKLARASDEQYLNVHGETIRWRFKEIIDVYGILDENLSDGTEVYSTFVNFRMLASLRDPSEGPWPAYLRAHPRADPDRVSVDQVVSWRAKTDRGRLVRILPVIGEAPWPLYRRAHPTADPARLKVHEVLEWYERLTARDRAVRAAKRGR